MSSERKPCRVKVVTCSTYSATLDTTAMLERAIEAAYAELNEEALSLEMAIVNTSISVSHGDAKIYYIITAHWISREALESERNRQRFMSGGKG